MQIEHARAVVPVKLTLDESVRQFVIGARPLLLIWRNRTGLPCAEVGYVAEIDPLADLPLATAEPVNSRVPPLLENASGADRLRARRDLSACPCNSSSRLRERDDLAAPSRVAHQFGDPIGYGVGGLQKHGVRVVCIPGRDGRFLVTDQRRDGQFREAKIGGDRREANASARAASHPHPASALGDAQAKPCGSRA